MAGPKSDLENLLEDFLTLLVQCSLVSAACRPHPLTGDAADGAAGAAAGADGEAGGAEMTVASRLQSLVLVGHMGRRRRRGAGMWDEMCTVPARASV